MVTIRYESNPVLDLPFKDEVGPSIEFEFSIYAIE
jgi:hypothetical protein